MRKTISVFFLLAFIIAKGQGRVYERQVSFDSLLHYRPIVLLYNYSQPAKYDLYVREIFDSLKVKYPGDFFILSKGLSPRSVYSVLNSLLYENAIDIPVMINDSIFQALSTEGESGIANLDWKKQHLAFHSIVEYPLQDILRSILNSSSLVAEVDTFEIKDEKYPTGFGNDFFKTDSGLILFNRQFNQILYYQLPGGNLKSSYQFDYNYDSLYIRALGFNPNQINYAKSHRNIFEKHKLPFHECNILSMSHDSAHIYFSLLIYFIRLEGKDITGEDSIALLPQYFLATSQSPFCLERLRYFLIPSDEVLPDGYASWFYHGFHVSDTTLFVEIQKPVNEILPDDTLPILVSYTREHLTYKFSKIEKFRLPDFFIQNQLFYSQASGIFFYWRDTLYYQFLIYPFAYNLSDGLSFSILDSCFLSAANSSNSLISPFSNSANTFLIRDVNNILKGRYLCYIYQCGKNFRYKIFSTSFSKIQDKVLTSFSSLADQEFDIENDEIILLKVGKEKTNLYEFKFE